MIKQTATIDANNPIADDMYLTNGQLTFLVPGTVEYIAQELSGRLKFLKGEWYLDQRQGVPYFEKIFVKAPNLDYITSIFRSVILGTQGVSQVKDLSVSLDTLTREAELSFSAIADTGDIIPIGDPFIVEIS